jgi:integrase
MAKAHLKLVSPARVNRTVTPKRKPNAAYRTHEHLSEGEVAKLIKAAKANRHGLRDSTMIFLAFRHGLRAAELVDLRWDQVDFEQRVLHVRRVKNGTPATHPLDGEETRAVCTENLNPDVLMMKSAENWRRYNAANALN